MLKNGKKFLLLLLSLALSAGALAGCGKTLNRDALEGYTSSDNAAESNGGFVVKKDNWYYFINGAEDYSADNTFGKVVKGSLMRISAENLEKGNYTQTDIVVPQLIITNDYTSGLFIYGDYVYYATPNTTKNMEGSIESSYLNFKRSKLDGSETMKDYYVQLSDNAAPYRYVVEDGTVYLLYVNTSSSEIHSLNTETDTDTVLVSGYSAYMFDADVESPTVYYTMAVTKKNTYPSSSTETYNQLYKVTASATQSPYTLDLSDGYVDSSKKEGDEGYQMEYVNLGTIVLDGVGSTSEPTPFNVDYKEGVTMSSAAGYTYELVKVTDGKIYLKITNNDESTASFVYALSADAVKDGWNSITANPQFTAGASGAFALVSPSSDKATGSALYFEQNGAQYYVYLDSSNAIQKVKAGETEESFAIAKQQEGATLLYLDGEYLYYSMAGTNGKALYRIKYTGTREDYNTFTGTAAENDDYKPTQYMKIDYKSDWFNPETLGGYVFFFNAESYSDEYVYVLDNPETNADLKALNEKYDDVQDAFTEISEKFADASNAAKYYYYTGSTAAIYEEEHLGEYEQEDLDVTEAFAACAAAHGLNFDNLKDGETAYNVQSYFYGLLGARSDEDAETIADSLATDLLLKAEE